MRAEPDYSLDSARAAADSGDLNRWVGEFLASPGSDNATLGRQLTAPPRSWTGPMKLPLDRLHRLAGPADHPVLCPTDEEEWRDDVSEMEGKVEDGWTPPPVIVTYRNDQLVLEDGNHRVESLRQAGEIEVWAIVGFESEADRHRFGQDQSASAN